jgi:hypothetical protein
MKVNFVVKGYLYGFKSVNPSATDVGYPLNYIWINLNTKVAYILDNLDNGIATWLVKNPDTVYNEGTDFQINIIGDISLLKIKVTSEAILPPNVVISDPVAGKYKITEIHLDEHKRMIATFDDEAIL